MVHRPTGTPLDVALAWLPFERQALGRADWLEFGETRIRVARPEDLIVYKAVAWRERDRRDVEQLLVLHGDTIDLDRVRDLVRDFAELLDDPGRVEQFDEVVRRALGET